MRNYNNYAFIDGQNLDKSIKGQGWLIDYKKFRQFLTSRFAAKRVFYFIGYIEDYLPLYKDLRKSNYSMCFRKPVIDKDGNIKANVDSNLITHTLIKINNYDKAIIVAGDSDYYFLAKYLMRQDKLCQVLVPCKSKCPKIYKKNNKFRNYISYISRQKDILYKKK